MYGLLLVKGTVITREHCLLENLQAFLLAVSALIFLWRAKKAGDLTPVYLCGALLCFTMFVREYDVRKLDLPEVVVTLGSGRGKDALFVLLWTLGIFNIALRFRAVFAAVRKSFLPSDLIMFIVAALFMVLGELFEKHVVPVYPHVFFEELAELNAYMILLAATFVTRPSASRVCSPSGIDSGKP